MATVIIFAVIVLAVVLGIMHQRKVDAAGCCGAGDVEKKVKVDDKNVKNYPYKTELICDDIHCKNCVTHVDNALNKLDGTYAKADLDSKKVTILSKYKPDVAKFQQILNDAGYPARLA